MKGCDDYRASIPLYLDEELETGDYENFRAHLNDCEACRAEVEEEEQLSRLLHRARPLYSAPDVLRERILALAEGARQPSAQFRVWIRRFGWPAGIAAAILLATGILAARQVLLQARANTYIESAMAAHRSFVNGSLSLAVQSSSPGVVTAFFNGKVPFKFRLPEETANERPYQLTGAQVVSYRGAHAALVGYEMQQEKISLLVASSRSAVVAGGEQVPSGGIMFHYFKRANFNVITWSTHGLTYALVSSLPGSGRQSCLVCHQDMANHGRFTLQ